MEKAIIKYIKEELVNEDIDELAATDDLLDSGVLDSMTMMRLITFIEDLYNIKVEPEEMIVENFMTVKDIGNYITSKL